MTTLNQRNNKRMEEATGCSHHWVIASPNGPTSRGVCRRCGATKEFHNSVPGFVGAWARSTSGFQRRVNDKSYKPVKDEPDDETLDADLETDNPIPD